MSTIGIVAALEAEARTLRRLPQCFRVTVSGMGAERAHVAAKRLVDAGATALVSWGCAAALDQRLEAGELVVAERVVDDANRSFAIDAEWRKRIVQALSARISRRDGALADAAHTLTSSEDKRVLRARTLALAADMESAGVARAAAALGVPFIALRAIADAADVAVPPALVSAVGSDGAIGAASVLRLAAAPWHWAAAARLGLGFRAALLSLRMAAPALYASAEADARDVLRRAAAGKGYAGA